jgi:hypothetical protein
MTTKNKMVIELIEKSIEYCQVFYCTDCSYRDDKCNIETCSILRNMKMRSIKYAFSEYEKVSDMPYQEVI